MNKQNEEIVDLDKSIRGGSEWNDLENSIIR